MSDLEKAGRKDAPIEAWMIAAATGRGPTPQQLVQIKGVDGGWFSPLQPMRPQAQQVKGRVRDYPVGENLQIFPKQNEGVPFWQLQALARNHDITRINIETRKDEVVRQEWDFALIDPDADDAATDKSPHIKALREFFKRPDRRRPFQRWMRKLLNDRLIYDAMAVEKVMSYGDTVSAWSIMDPTTFKLLTNIMGEIPTVEEGPAFQQILKGLPAVNYKADELVYWISNEQSGCVYGFSPVEWIVLTVNIALRREMSTLQYFTEGNIPDAIIGVPEDWGVDQINALQQYWDSLLEGDTAARRRAKFVPGKFNYTPTREPQLKAEIDEWLARVSCAALKVAPSPYIRQMNRATAQNAKESAEEQGLLPELTNFESFMNHLIQDHMGFTDCEFRFDLESDLDPEVQAKCSQIYVQLGIESVDEVRERDLKLPPIGMGNAFMSPTGGPMLLEHYLEEADLEHKNTMDTLKNPPDPKLLAAPPAGGKNQPPPGQQQAGGEWQNAPPKPDGGQGGKVAKAAGKKHIILKPHGRNLKATQPAARILQRTIKRFFRKQAPIVADKLANHLGFEKATDDDQQRDPQDSGSADANAQTAVESLDFSAWAVLADDTAEALQGVYAAGGKVAIKSVGVEMDEDMFSQVNEEALDYAKDRAAELVGRKWVNGQLVDNPDADMAITDSTREMLKALVSKALQEGWSRDKLADAISSADVFSDRRAQLIAQTEVAIADGKGQMQGYRESGVVNGKVWQLSADHDHDDECDDNAGEGVIPLDDEFDSGDDAEPAHPGCLCVVAPVVIQEGEE